MIKTEIFNTAAKIIIEDQGNCDRAQEIIEKTFGLESKKSQTIVVQVKRELDSPRDY